MPDNDLTARETNDVAIARLAQRTVFGLVALMLVLVFAEFVGGGWSHTHAKFLSSGVLISLAAAIATVALAAIAALTFLAKKWSDRR